MASVAFIIFDEMTLAALLEFVSRLEISVSHRTASFSPSSRISAHLSITSSSCEFDTAAVIQFVPPFVDRNAESIVKVARI
jgi:hypothetical protein